MNRLAYILIWTGIFAAAMAFPESAVVVYLRALYYPEGFAFPLKVMDQSILVTEIFREAATLIMLFTIAIIATKSRIARFAVFIYTFAIWDIFYYIYLFFLIGWPSSFFTWDLLFLIPITWVGPVLAPVINSLTMILLAVIILHHKAKDRTFHLTFFEWFLLITGSLIMIFVYTRPYVSYLLERFSISEIIHYRQNRSLLKYSAGFKPETFNWFIYALGQLLFFWSIIHVILRIKRK
jgi:hypothetical protein